MLFITTKSCDKLRSPPCVFVCGKIGLIIWCEIYIGGSGLNKVGA